MNQESLITTLKQIKTLASECLTALGEDKPSSTGKRKKSTITKQNVGNALPELILGLRDKNFFKEPRTAREVHEKLRATYPCEVNRVAMALLRLNGRKSMRKASKLVEGKSQVAYVW